MASSARQRVFSLDDWTSWLDDMAHKLLSVSGNEFEEAYRAGRLEMSGSVADLAAVLSLIERLRQAARCEPGESAL